MITFENEIINEILNQEEIITFYLVKIGNLIKTTDYATDLIMFESEDLYKSDGRLASIQPPQLTSTVDRSKYSITLIDNEMSLGQVFESNDVIGSNVEVRLGFIDNRVNGSNLPLTNIDETVVVYSGQVDSYAYQVSTQIEGSVVLNLECTSPMGALDLKKPFWGSKEYIKNLNVNDSSFDQVYEGSTLIRLKWGRK